MVRKQTIVKISLKTLDGGLGIEGLLRYKSLVKKYLFFDNASTTPCCEEAMNCVQRFARECYGNPSSSHVLGQQSARAIRESRMFFAEHFGVNPSQVIFTGSGSEADNLAVYGIALDALARKNDSTPLRIITSAIEHPAVRKTVQSLASLGFDVQLAPVDKNGQIIRGSLIELLTPNTALVSIMQVNNIVGAVQAIEDLAKLVKTRVPQAIFHTDAVQAFGRVSVPKAPSSVDLVSISGHKVEGPKGVGALIVLNRKLIEAGLRPLIWGGEQEGGFRSGTQNAGLIAGFRAAAEKTLTKREKYVSHTRELRERFLALLQERKLLTADSATSIVLWNSPKDAVPHIVSLSVPGFPSGPLAKLLEERGCLVSTGSACSSQKMEPDAVLAAMGLSPAIQGSAIRISFSDCNNEEDVEILANALDESIQLMKQLLGSKSAR